ncbi:MAG: hypothetical protein GEU99_23000 [Luteitalea sp.]|nr:hypothetical protein [Luteitalea sp.]
MKDEEQHNRRLRVRPPRLARWLLRRALPRDTRAASIAGDLFEELNADAATRSRVVATGRYWWHALSIAARYMFRSRRTHAAAGHAALPVPAGRRGSMWLGALRDDLRDARRSLFKHPGFAVVAVLTLAVGVGANTAIFSVLHAVVLRDLPYHDADRLALLWTLKLGQNSRDGSSYLNVRDWQEQSGTFEDMAVYFRPEHTRATITGGQEPERVYLALVGPGFFQLLRAPALLGRTLEAADFDSDRGAVVISHGLWRQRFAGDPGVVGKSIEVNGRVGEVVGVMAAGFELLTPDAQLWVPISVVSFWKDLQRNRDGDALMVIGRLSPTATFESARAELDTVAARFEMSTRMPTPATGSRSTR